MNAINATLLFWCAGLTVAVVVQAALLWRAWVELEELKQLNYRGYMEMLRGLEVLRRQQHVHIWKDPNNPHG